MDVHDVDEAVAALGRDLLRHAGHHDLLVRDRVQHLLEKPILPGILLAVRRFVLKAEVQHVVVVLVVLGRIPRTRLDHAGRRYRVHLEVGP
eukprot:4994193-Prymnesium_polylepis.2